MHFYEYNVAQAVLTICPWKFQAPLEPAWIRLARVAAWNFLGPTVSPKWPWNEKGRDNSIQLGMKREETIPFSVDWKGKKQFTRVRGERNQGYTFQFSITVMLIIFNHRFNHQTVIEPRTAGFPFDSTNESRQWPNSTLQKTYTISFVKSIHHHFGKLGLTKCIYSWQMKPRLWSGLTQTGS